MGLRGLRHTSCIGVFVVVEFLLNLAYKSRHVGGIMCTEYQAF